MRLDGLCRRSAVFRKQGVGDAIGEGRVGRVMDLDELKRQKWCKGVDDHARTAIACIRDDLERAQRVGIEIAQQVLDIGRPMFQRDQRGADVGQGRAVFRRPGFDGFKARVSTNRLRAGADELHAVVADRVMAGRHHDSAVHFEMERGEINLFGAAEPDVVDFAATLLQPQRQCIDQGLAGVANIAADDDTLGPQLGRVRAPDAKGQFRRQVVRHLAAYVIGFETTQAGHAFRSFECECGRQ